VLTTERNDYQTINITTNERMKEIQHAKQVNLEINKKIFRNTFIFLQEHQEDLVDLINEKDILEQKILDLEQNIREWAQKFLDATDKQKLLQINHEHLLNNIKRQYKCKKNFLFAKEILVLFKDSILTYCINQMYDGIDRKNDMKLSNTIEYLLSKLEITISSTRKIQDLWKQQNDSDEC
jgi:macrodomain Ter protein organizer (MatP/YcbG family)